MQSLQPQATMKPNSYQNHNVVPKSKEQFTRLQVDLAA